MPTHSEEFRRIAGELEIRAFQCGQVVYIDLAGELDIAAVGALSEMVQKLTSAECRGLSIKVSLRRLSFVDLRGLRAFSGAVDLLQSCGLAVMPIAVSSSFSRLANLAGLKLPFETFVVRRDDETTGPTAEAVRSTGGDMVPGAPMHTFEGRRRTDGG